MGVTISTFSGILAVKHNIEVAHRLSLLPGKCQNIHGHSMIVNLGIGGMVNEKGILEGIDFADIKKDFRSYLDTEYDHRLLLNATDPWCARMGIETTDDRLPGLRMTEGDPTTENIARWVGQWAQELLPKRLSIHVRVDETAANGFILESL